MKIKLKNILIVGIILQIISTQGILTFNFFNLFGQWELKSFIHPLAFLLVFVYFVLETRKKIKITFIDFFLLSYSIFCFFILVYNNRLFASIYLSFREVFLLFLLVFIYNKTNISSKQWGIIMELIYYLVLLNLFFIGLTYYLGPEDYMKFLTNRFYWTHDPLYKFKISNFHKFWRSPGLVGSAGALGHFGLLAYILFDGNVKYNRKKYFALLLVCVCFIRSAYLALGIYILLQFLIKKKNLKQLTLYVKLSIPFLLGGYFFIYKKNFFSVESVIARINNWFQNVNVDYNIFYGGAIGRLGAAARGEGFVSTMDSYWIYMFLSIGLIGVFLTIIFFYEKTYKISKLKILCIAMLIAGFFVSFNQSIPFLVLFPLLFLKRNEIQHFT